MSDSTVPAADTADPQSAALIADFKARLEADPIYRGARKTADMMAAIAPQLSVQVSAVYRKYGDYIEARTSAFRAWDIQRGAALTLALSGAADDASRQSLIEASDSTHREQARRLAEDSALCLLTTSRARLVESQAILGVLHAVEVRWVLSGEASESIDHEVGLLINRGVQVEAVEAGRKYRLNGPRDLCDGLVTPDDKREGAKFIIDYEVPPVDSINMGTRAAPGLQYRRQLFIHGGADALRAVARAIDRGLIVVPVGNLRFSVTGRTAALMAWAATVVHCKPLEEVLPLYGLTPHMVAEEDGTPVAGPLSVAVVSMPEPGPLSVNVVSLPDRETTTQVVRDQSGEIREVRHTETTR